MNRRQRRAGLAFARSTRNEWHPFERVEIDPDLLAEHRANVGDLAACFRNNVYSVQMFIRSGNGHGPCRHLAIRRHDEAPIQGWDDLQRIKAELLGRERVAIEIYPAEDEVVNQANMRHLFVLPPGARAPFTIRGHWS